MNPTFRPMCHAAADEIRHWRYPAPYDFYDLDADADDLAEFLDAANWPDACFAGYDEEELLLGWFVFDRRGSTASVGVGMRPDLTGKGLGTLFVAAGLDFGATQLNIDSYTLEVAAFNERAINVYRRLRFRPIAEFVQATNGGMHPFVRMQGPAIRRGACILLADHQGRVTLQLRDAKRSIGGGDCWALFGGGTEPGESPEQTIVREMREELCIDLDPTRLRHVRHMVTGTRLRTDVFHYALQDELTTAVLQEGQRFGSFARPDVHEGMIEGKRVVPYHLEVLDDFWDGGFEAPLS